VLDDVLNSPFSPVLDQEAEAYPQEAAFWRERMAPYCRPRVGRSVLDLLTSVVPYLLVSVGMYFVIRVSPWIAVALAPVSAIFLLRIFMVFHDCTHGSFLPARRGNQWLGMITGVLVLTPFARWRHDHAVHHSSAGDLDRRGIGDLPTLTVEEYRTKSRRERIMYRALRHPLVMFGVGPIIAMIIGPRLVARDAPARMRRSVLLTDLVLAVVFAALIWAIGIGDLMLVWGPSAFLSGAIGIWLFYVQHQFEDVYWERSGDWGYADAALRGSSFLKLPRPLKFATANIGYHHVHHLSVRIPNYNLQRAHEETPEFASVPVLTLMDGLRATRLKLWDEKQMRLVTFAEAHV
jgi:omega-6 fatty acid desaturase (delta-12 desaturase)